MKRLLQWLKDIFDGGGIDVIILVDKYGSGPFDSTDQDMIKAYNNLFDGGGDGSAENLWKHGVIAFTNAWVVDRQPLDEGEELRPWDMSFKRRLTKVHSVFDAMKMPRPKGVAVELLPMVQEKNSRGETLLPDRKTEQDALLWHAIAGVVARSSATVQIKAPIMEQVLCALAEGGELFLQIGEQILKLLVFINTVASVVNRIKK